MAALHASQSTAAPQTPVRSRAVVCYAVGGDLRYLSHHDEMRMLKRALARADWPVSHSQGFNPQPRLSIALPRPVGLAAADQLAIIQLMYQPPQHQLFERLAAALPCGITLGTLSICHQSRAPQPAAAVYQVKLEPNDLKPLADRLSDVLTAERLVIARRTAPRKPDREIDLRPLIRNFELAGPLLRCHLRFQRQTTARPREILELLELPVERYGHRMERTNLVWNMGVGG